MRTSTKLKIKSLVEHYKTILPEEYVAVCASIKEYKKTLNDEYASMKGSHAIKRALYEIPENLSNLFTQELSEDQLVEFREKTSAFWFMKTFPEFSLADKI